MCCCDGVNFREKCDNSNEIEYVADLQISISIPSLIFKKKSRSKNRKTVECTQCNRKMRSDNLKRHLQQHDHSDINVESKKVKIADDFQFSIFITGY